MSDEVATTAGARAVGAGPPPPKVAGVQFRHAAGKGEALASLKAFVRSLGVEEPANTEAELLLQAAPFMSESLDDNLKHAWTPEERARLDAQPIPQQLDHTNRDHEYFFFKQMRESLDRRASCSSSFSTQRGSADVASRHASLQGSLDASNHSRQASPVPESGSSVSSGEDTLNPWQRRADNRRRNLQAVWGEEGRAVLTALDSLPEDVLLDADTTPPMSPTYGSLELAREEPADAEQQKQGQQKQGQQQQAKQHSKDRKFWCF